MENKKYMVKELLNSYCRYYQICLKLVVNNTVYFSNFTDENESTLHHFNVNNQNINLSCSKENFEKQLEVMSIAICEMIQEEDVYSLFEKGLKEELNSEEKDCFINTYQTNLYSIGLIESNHVSEHLYEILKSMITYPICQLVHDKKIAFLIPKDVDPTLMMELKDTLEAECYCRVYCSSSSLFELDNLQKAYKEASEYLELMKKYDGSFIYANQKDCFFPYVIDSIEEDKAKFILSKIDIHLFDQMDEELLNTIQVFLRNNLSIAETSRQLYLHRNTLIYRLDKIMHIMGLDIRNFEDAVKMEILLLLKKRFS